jgi:2'-5' RNA ligase
MSRGPTARLFVAVDPPARVREALAGWTRGAAADMDLRPARGPGRPLRVLDAEALHLTLCFLGSRPVEEIDEIGEALRASAARVGELSVGAPLWLPPRRARVLAIEIHDTEGELARLQRRVRDAISETISWEPERRRFRAHVTVARVREQPGGGGSERERRPLPATPQLRFTPESAVLYRSWLSPAGATYEPLATCGLTTVEP